MIKYINFQIKCLANVVLCFVLFNCGSKQEDFGLPEHKVPASQGVGSKSEIDDEQTSVKLKLSKFAENIGKTTIKKSFRDDLYEYSILLNGGGILYMSKKNRLITHSNVPYGMPNMSIDVQFDEKPEGVQLTP